MSKGKSWCMLFKPVWTCFKLYLCVWLMWIRLYHLIERCSTNMAGLYSTVETQQSAEEDYRKWISKSRWIVWLRHTCLPPHYSKQSYSYDHLLLIIFFVNDVFVCLFTLINVIDHKSNCFSIVCRYTFQLYPIHTATNNHNGCPMTI